MLTLFVSLFCIVISCGNRQTCFHILHQTSTLNRFEETDDIEGQEEGELEDKKEDIRANSIEEELTILWKGIKFLVFDSPSQGRVELPSLLPLGEIDLLFHICLIR